MTTGRHRQIKPGKSFTREETNTQSRIMNLHFFVWALWPTVFFWTCFTTQNQCTSPRKPLKGLIVTSLTPERAFIIIRSASPRSTWTMRKACAEAASSRKFKNPSAYNLASVAAAAAGPCFRRTFVHTVRIGAIIVGFSGDGKRTAMEEAEMHRVRQVPR